jgi:hypothetical protein
MISRLSDFNTGAPSGSRTFQRVSSYSIDGIRVEVFV